MNKIKRHGNTVSRTALRQAIWTITLACLILAYGCGGGEPAKSTAKQYPTGYSTDLKEQLKYDERVESFEESDANTLVVNVKDYWMSSPEGIRQRTLEQWFGLWAAAHGASDNNTPKGLKIVVKHNDDDVASWTSEKGYQPAQKRKGDGSVARSS